MTKFYILICGLGLFGFSLQTQAHNTGQQTVSPDQKKFGATIAQTTALKLGEVIQNFGQYQGKRIVLEATPQKVCEKKGCWMVLKDKKHQVRTLFKDYGFFVPKTIVGQKVRVQGIMEKKTISAATRRHYMKDAGKSARDIKKIKTSEIQYQFTADAVEII